MSLSPEAKYAWADDFVDFAAAYEPVHLITEWLKLIKWQYHQEIHFMTHDFSMKELANYCPLHNVILC